MIKVFLATVMAFATLILVGCSNQPGEDFIEKSFSSTLKNYEELQEFEILSREKDEEGNFFVTIRYVISADPKVVENINIASGINLLSEQYDGTFEMLFFKSDDGWSYFEKL